MPLPLGAVDGVVPLIRHLVSSFAEEARLQIDIVRGLRIGHSIGTPKT